MNPCLTYDNMFLWKRDTWNRMIGPANTMFRWAIREGLYHDDGIVHNEPLPEGTWPHERLQCHMVPKELQN